MKVFTRSSERLVLDLLLARRAVDAVQLTILALLSIAYLVATRPVDSTTGLQPVPVVIGLLILATGTRMSLAYLGREVGALRLVWPVLDVALLYFLLLVYAWQYQLAPTAILKATTADAVFLLIALRVVQFDARILATTGASAAMGWILLTIYAVEAADPGKVTHSFVEYMTSDKVLIGAQVERILMVTLVTLVISCALLLMRRDALTGLGNRTWFLNRLIDGSQVVISQQAPVLLLIEIDCGHAMRAAGGYDLTQQAVEGVARQLTAVCTRRDVVARIGDCSFAILTHGLEHRQAAEAFASRCLAGVEAGSEIGSYSVKGRAAVGVAFADADVDAATLWGNAQAALAAAMSGRRGRVVVFDESARSEAEQRLRLEADLRSALRLRQLELHYQPIVRPCDQALTGIEALMRWRHPQLGFIGPALFIPIAEETGLIVEMGAWAIGQAVADYKELVAAGASPKLLISVNVAPRQVEEWAALEAAVQAALAEGCPIKLELTESALNADVETVRGQLSSLALLGAALAIDDFGTGYSSYGQLWRMPFHTLKIDRQFITGVLEPEGRAVVQGIVNLARSLRLSVTAEGVETPEQQAVLGALGVHELQGYLFGKPMPIEEMIDKVAGDGSDHQDGTGHLRDARIAAVGQA